MAASLVLAEFRASLATVIVRSKSTDVLRVDGSNVVVFERLAPRPPGVMPFLSGARR